MNNMHIHVLSNKDNIVMKFCVCAQVLLRYIRNKDTYITRKCEINTEII